MISRIRKAMDEREGGFTLIELLVVIIIIGILAAIAVPTFLNQRTKGWEASAKSELRNLSTAQESFYTDNNRYTGDTGANGLGGQGYNRSANLDIEITVADQSNYIMCVRNQAGGNKFVMRTNDGTGKGAPMSLGSHDAGCPNN